MTREEQTHLILQKIREIADKDYTIFTTFSHTPLPKKDVSNEISNENFDFCFDKDELKTTKKDTL